MVSEESLTKFIELYETRYNVVLTKKEAMAKALQDAELKPNNIGLRLFDQIDIYLHNEGVFVAQDMTSKL